MPDVISDVTGLMYHERDVRIGTELSPTQNSTHLTAKNFMLVCEVPILHCSTVDFDVGDIQNGTLHVTVDNEHNP